MHGFPNHIATRQDFENLLNMQKYKEEALKKLDELARFDDRKVTRAIKQVNEKDPMSEWEVEEIDNPLPVHAQKGFVDKKQGTEKEKIKQGWYEIPKLIADKTKRKYEDVLKEYEELQPRIVEVKQ